MTLITPLLAPVIRLFSPAGSKARLSILIYHRVAPEPDPLFPLEVDAQRFTRQMQALAQHFHVLPLREAVDRLQSGTLPSGSACITFDDGYADNAQVALPILKNLGLPATFFVASGYLDGGVMFNDRVIEAIRATSLPQLDLSEISLGYPAVSTLPEKRTAIRSILGQIKYRSPEERHSFCQYIEQVSGTEVPRHLMMTSHQVRLLHHHGMTIGGHTLHHPILASLQNELEAREEIRLNKEHLEQIIEAPVDLFAYPNGVPDQDYRAEHAVMVRSLGYRAAVTTARGVATLSSDPFQLPRFTPWEPSISRYSLRLVQNLLNTRPQLATL